MASVLSQVCLIGAGEYRERKKEGKQVKERERERESTTWMSVSLIITAPLQSVIRENGAAVSGTRQCEH